MIGQPLFLHPSLFLAFWGAHSNIKSDYCALFFTHLFFCLSFLYSTILYRLCKSWWSNYVSLQFHFAYFFLQLQDLSMADFVPYFLICNMISVGEVEHSSKASHFYSLCLFLLLSCTFSCLTSMIKEDWNDKECTSLTLELSAKFSSVHNSMGESNTENWHLLIWYCTNTNSLDNPGRYFLCWSVTTESQYRILSTDFMCWLPFLMVDQGPNSPIILKNILCLFLQDLSIWM